MFSLIYMFISEHFSVVSTGNIYSDLNFHNCDYELITSFPWIDLRNVLRLIGFQSTAW